ncbi:MAG TPA: methyltransferase domain-containing protein [Patescibacteria group bacterium]|jgi:predicted methyltransferase|nr:methyltransferase domain-containing protein [Patescibacteria group bacterium]
MKRTVLSLLAATLLVAPLVASPKLDLNAPGRTAEEKERDKFNKPDDLYAFWGIKQGDTVLDFIPGDGYNTYLLSQLVGPKGKVIAVGSYEFDKLEARLKANPLPNVQHLKNEGLDALAEGSVDVVVTIRNYHDLGADRRDKVLAGLKRALKPGGVLGVVDARTKSGRDVPNHRIADDVIRTEITAAGFKLAGTSEMLGNKDDDYSKPNWEKRYALDQSCFKFVK